MDSSHGLLDLTLGDIERSHSGQIQGQAPYFRNEKRREYPIIEEDLGKPTTPLDLTLPV